MQILGNVIKRQVAGAVLRTVVQQFFTIIFQKESECGRWEAVSELGPGTGHNLIQAEQVAS